VGWEKAEWGGGEWVNRKVVTVCLFVLCACSGSSSSSNARTDFKCDNVSFADLFPNTVRKLSCVKFMGH